MEVEGGRGKREENFIFQAEDGIRDFCLSRGLGDVYKKQVWRSHLNPLNPASKSLANVSRH